MFITMYTIALSSPEASGTVLYSTRSLHIFSKRVLCTLGIIEYFQKPSLIINDGLWNYLARGLYKSRRWSGKVRWIIYYEIIWWINCCVIQHSWHLMDHCHSLSAATITLHFNFTATQKLFNFIYFILLSLGEFTQCTSNVALHYNAFFQIKVFSRFHYVLLCNL